MESVSCPTPVVFELARQSRLFLTRVRVSRQSWAALVGFKDLADLALAFTGHLEEVLSQFDRLFLRTRIQDCEACDHLLRFGEGSVCNAELVLREPDPGPRCSRQAPLGCEQKAAFEAVFDKLPHPGHFFRRWRRIPLDCL